MRAARIAAAALSLAVLTGTTGCAVTVDNVPLPKPGIGGPGYTIHVVFDDALNLPERAHVKIGGTDIGVVEEISTTNFLADVELEIREDIRLPRGTTAELRQATPLGDIFVAMTLPEHDPNAPVLQPGDTIGTDLTSAGASVEQLMVSISMLLNGGGLNQAAKITSEMNSMFAGRAPQLAHLLNELGAAITALNQRTADIDSVLHGLNVLTGEMAARKAELGEAADTFPALLGLVAENNRDISALIGKVSVTMAALGDFTETTGGDFVSLFDSIQKLMGGFTAMGDDLGQMLQRYEQLYPSIAASFEGEALSVAATVSYLSIGALTDPSGSRPPELNDVPLFIGSLAQVIEKVIGRLTSPPRQEGGR
ncbi:MCE family protein [Nocardia farcinica]|uniref:MCE family protein n=1 Tax=Nocardia farcinica TaxID=37329 RepID=UPI00189359B7|nr:MCE family protein [Nocardia farcinica]MBF6445272.1 MCE family protein [Nocardia farcinica]MBF6519497.1 MCE family protein [Nocardia farcinica]